jgi:hypothetical protein
VSAAADDDGVPDFTHATPAYRRGAVDRGAAERRLQRGRDGRRLPADFQALKAGALNFVGNGLISIGWGLL